MVYKIILIKFLLKKYPKDPLLNILYSPAGISSLDSEIKKAIKKTPSTELKKLYVKLRIFYLSELIFVWLSLFYIIFFIMHPEGIRKL